MSALCVCVFMCVCANTVYWNSVGEVNGPIGFGLFGECPCLWSLAGQECLGLPRTLALVS